MKTAFPILIVILAGTLFGCVQTSETAPPVGVLLEELPPVHFGSEEYRVDSLIEVAAKLRAVGKDVAVKALRVAAEDRRQKDLFGGAVILLCRMLFTAKPDNDFRRPRIGGPLCLGGSDYKEWPLEPIEIVDGIPFVIVRGYNLGGSAETPEYYLEYCFKECDWGTTEFKPRTAEEKQKALEKLLASPKWKTPLRDHEKEFLADQIK